MQKALSELTDPYVKRIIRGSGFRGPISEDMILQKRETIARHRDKSKPKIKSVRKRNKEKEKIWHTKTSAKKILKEEGIAPELINDELISDCIKKNKIGYRHKGVTRPAAYEDQKYCYYYIEDGECSLKNPVVFKRLISYVYKVIRFTKWIHKKSFVDAETVLIEVQDELKDLRPFQYGDEKTDAITFLIKKINTQVGREWWKYLKINEPYKYNKLVGMQKTCSKERAVTRSQKESNKKMQAKRREDISESYLLMLIQANLRYQTGMKYTFDEIRVQYPNLIEEKRSQIEYRRIKSQQNKLRKQIKLTSTDGCEAI